MPTTADPLAHPTSARFVSTARLFGNALSEWPCEPRRGRLVTALLELGSFLSHD